MPESTFECEICRKIKPILEMSETIPICNECFERFDDNCINCTYYEDSCHYLCQECRNQANFTPKYNTIYFYDWAEKLDCILANCEATQQAYRNAVKIHQTDPRFPVCLTNGELPIWEDESDG